MSGRTSQRKRWAVDRQQVLILLVAAVMVGSFILLILWPQQRRLSDLGQAVRQERDLVNRKVQASQEGVYVSARIPGLRRAQDVLTRRLPTEPRIAEFLQMVSECTACEPCVTHEVQRAETPIEGPTPAVPLRLRLVGPFEAVYRCVAGLEHLERLNRLRRVRFEKASPDGCVVAEAEIVLYYLPEAAKEESGSPDGGRDAVVDG